MRRGAGTPQLHLPELAPWMRNLMVGLFAMYVGELVARNIGLPIDTLAWSPFEAGFQVWQPLTRYLVQGGTRGSVFDVLFGLLVLYFLLPAVGTLLSRHQATRALLAGVVGGTLVPLLLNALVPMAGVNSGWTVLTTTAILLFGLAMPSGVVHLWFVIPITGRTIVWGSLGLATVFFLIDPALRTSEGLGTWLGVYGWWMGLGPGSRRRRLLSEAQKVQRELSRFEVIEGGRRDPRPSRNRPTDHDDWIH